MCRGREVGSADILSDVPACFPVCLSFCLTVCPSLRPLASELSLSSVNKQRDNVVGESVLATGPAGPIVRGAAPFQRAPLRSQDLPVLQR